MNSIIIPCSPKECEQIANGDMTVLVRKIAPREVPFKAYVYCTKKGRPLVYAEPNAYYTEPIMHRTYGRNREEANRIWDIYNGKVAIEFICDYVIDGASGVQEWISIRENCGLCGKDLYEYCGEDKDGETKYCKGLHLTELKIYDEPRELSDFKICKVIRGYHKKDEKNETFADKLESLKHSKRVEVKRLNKAPATYCYVEED